MASILHLAGQSILCSSTSDEKNLLKFLHGAENGLPVTNFTSQGQVCFQEAPAGEKLQTLVAWTILLVTTLQVFSAAMMFPSLLACSSSSFNDSSLHGHFQTLHHLDAFQVVSIPSALGLGPGCGAS